MKFITTLLVSLILVNASAQKKYIFSDSILITLKSGVTVTATVCRDVNDSEPKPAILMYNIYSIDRLNKMYALISESKGYVGVVVNTRGKMMSKDDIEPFEHDAEDAYEIIDWVSKQQWCNGKVGMYGGSYLGFSQWASVKKIHPALKTIVPIAAVGIGIDFPMQNSVFCSYMLKWIHFVTDNKTLDVADFSNDKRWDSVYKSWYVSGRSFNSLDSVDGWPDKIFHRWLNHPSYDEYWKKMTPQNAEFANINIPVLTMTGYYDIDQLGALYYYKQLATFNKNANQFLVIGPYDHDGIQGSAALSSILGYKTDSVANIKIYKLIFGWFDYILKDSIKPALLQDRINYEVMNENKWKHTATFHEMNNDTLTFFLNADKKLTPSVLNKNSYSNLSVDFNNRTDTTGMSRTLQISDTTFYKNKNMMIFISNPLNHDIEMNGSVTGSIDAIINKKDLDFNVQLYELTSDGKYFLLNNIVFRASYAKDNGRRHLLKSGKKETIPINNTFFVSKLIKENSRLVFVLGINKNYNYEINYGTGKDVSNESIADGKVPLSLKIYSDSFIKIPIYK